MNSLSDKEQRKKVLIKPSDFTPHLHHTIKVFEEQCIQDITRVLNNRSYTTNNLNRDERMALQNLKSLCKDFRFMKSDKGSNIVIMSQETYNNKMLDIINNGDEYEIISLHEIKRTSGLTIYQTPFITGIQGGTARMNCTLSEVSVGPVRWYKEGNQQPLVYSQSESEKPNQRVSRTVKEGPTRETDHSIKFSPLRLEDAGVYYCVKFKSDKVTVVTNGSGTHLHVNSAYSQMIYQAPSVTGKEGGTVKMNCTVPHESLGPVRWYKEANLEKVLYSQLLGDKSDARASRIVHEEQERKNDFSITFSNITLEDAGVYYCVKFKSDNVTLAATGSGTRLYVSSAYELTIYQTPTVTSVEGDAVIMQCTLSQEIVGPVHWYKGSNRHKILYSQSESDKPDPRVSRTIKEGRTRETDLSITFKNIALEDAGTYYCVKFKSDKVTVAASGSGTRLYVSRGSDLMIYQTLFVAGVEGDTVMMHCTLSEETVGPVRWYKGSNLKKLLYSQLSDHNSDARVSQIVHDGPTRDTDHSIAFTDITLEDAGVYYCVKLKSNGVAEAATGSGTQLNITSSIPS
ncbi:obscurin-like [Protopterus annectens]|uniref:obscurin-like n=1 Tax=Protopterus annectens TaxID=7888 RepID=UPI001CF97309|nr:obscurin-like [Protopterus annectens]